MIDDVSDIAAFYDSDPRKEHLRLEREQLEYDLTWRYLERYLPSRASVLEVGAGTGRYTLELARRGYKTTAVDLSAANIAACRQNLAAAGLEKQVRLLVADGRDLHAVTERNFEAVLLMGPLYHLIESADRLLALKEAYDRLREGGLIFSALLSRYGTIADMLKNHPGWIEDQADVHSLLERGKRPDEYPGGGFRGYFVQTSEIAPLHEAGGFETMVVAGVEPAISADDASYNNLQGKQRRLWLDLLYEISTEKSILGASRHLLYIGRKK
jgi:S-adenosylmethionine-dependent methyltransferase